MPGMPRPRPSSWILAGVLAILAPVAAAGCSNSTVAATSTTTRPGSTEPAPPAVPHPFGRLTCLPEDGIRFCQGGLGTRAGHTQDLRIPSFDGVPLDADVALPAKGRGPFPLIVMLNGLDGAKTNWETKTDDHAIDDVTFASMGYAVLMYTSRGFGNSCGTAQSRAGTKACAKGWIHLADQRYEIRDTQYLAGMLVDEGLVRPGIAVTGISYGGGQSLELAMLKNRVRELDGSLVPWTSPAHRVPMYVAAVYAEWPWDDLVTALLPNGLLTSSADTLAASDITPYGVEKQSWNSLLYNAAKQYFVAPEGADPSADLTNWFDIISKGEPYPPSATAILQQIQTYHSAIGVPMPSGGPAPTVLQNGWTDTLFPASEGMHYAEEVAATGSRTPLLEIFDDVGHGWAQGKAGDVAMQNGKAIAFLNAVMLHTGAPPTGVVAVGTTCPKSAASQPTVTYPSIGAFNAIPTISATSAGPQVVTSGGGSSKVANDLDPAYLSPYCQSLPAAREPGTALYDLSSASTARTLVGALKIAATLRVTGEFPELIGRLWDVNPATNTRQLIEAGDLRLSVLQSSAGGPSGKASEQAGFELEPNMYTVPAGHVVELELLGSSAPWFRASNGKFEITVMRLTCTIGILHPASSG